MQAIGRLVIFAAVLLGVTASAQDRHVEPRARPADQETRGQQELGPRERSALHDIGQSIAEQSTLTAETQKRWEALLNQMAASGIPVDINALVQWVMRESYMRAERDLEEQREKTRRLNEQKQAIRQQRQQLQDQASGAPAARDALDAEIRDWEEQLQTIGEDAQLADIDLEHMLQKQQQTVVMLSGISKQLHDMGMHIIRKVDP